MKTVIKYILMGVVGVGLIVFGVTQLVATWQGGGHGVVTTSFIEYDIARAIMGDNAKIKMLLPPGAEMHSFEPTPQDIVDIKNAKLFIFNGGESEEWVKELIRDNNIPDGRTLKLMDLVELNEEEITPEMETDEDGHGDGHEDGDEHEDDHEYDEHIWTSPVNVIKLTRGVLDKLVSIFPENTEKYTANAQKYIERLSEIDQKIRTVVENSPKKLLIFGDRFPFLYFVREYGLDYAAAFPGCAEQTEASAATVAKLIEKARETGTKVILKIELSSNKIAQTIADEISGRVMELSAAHNITKTDFENGVTYADIMEQNIEVLKEALGDI